jgi:hypothetical protein
MSDLYDTDVVIWSERQADLLGCMAAGEWVNDQIDWANVAEEIAALGISDRRELRNRVRTILAHLLKLQISSAIEQRAGWCDTILEQRAQLRTLLRQQSQLEAHLAKCDQRGAARGARTGAGFAGSSQGTAAHLMRLRLASRTSKCSVHGCQTVPTDGMSTCESGAGRLGDDL